MNKQREIKFRIWDKKKKKMFYQENQGWTGNNGFVSLVEIYTGYENSDEWKNYEVMQFTGLLDRDGKEIYEGDIVKFLYNSIPQEEHIGIVSWNNDYQGWEFDGLLIEPTPKKTMEIIGSVFENPKLLVNNKK